jgi:hypothetical protein
VQGLPVSTSTIVVAVVACISSKNAPARPG